MIRQCFEQAKTVLKDNSTRLGVIAGREYYNDIWCRDAFISCLGMSASEDDELFKISEKTLASLGKFQKPNGQMPNKISPDGKKVCFGAGGCVDSSLWYPIAVLNHYRNGGGGTFLKHHAARVEKAVEWAGCLDQNNDTLLETNDGADWMDLLVRSGRVLYDQVLYYKALLAADEIQGIAGKKRLFTSLAKSVRNNVNIFFWPQPENADAVKKLYGYSGIDRDYEMVMQSGDKGYYYADVGFRKYDPRCDVFANLLAVCFDVADKKKAASIMDHIKASVSPYPVRVLDPAISQDDYFRPFYFRPTDLPHLQQPGNYHNGGVWPMAGGFYVIALKKLGIDWNYALESLAAANRQSKNGSEWEFNEWLNPEGIPMGSAYQSWSAAMYILAYEYVKTKAKLWWLCPYN